MTAGASSPGAAHTGRSLSVLLFTALALRALPAILWWDLPIIRDEQSYVWLAEHWLQGRGVQPTPHGWLWAPLYPAFIALHALLFGSFAWVRATQIALALLATWLVYRLGFRLGGARVGLCAGWLYALEPTLIAFSHYLWTEHLYSVWLLLALEGALAVRERRLGLSLLPGAALGLAALTRGVGTYLAPFLLPALLWKKRAPAGQAWARAGLLVLAAAALVLPYSLHASRKFGGWVLVDTSLGFNMWLGNNEFEPVTFDYQMGGDRLDESDYARLGGRSECWDGLPAPEKNRCEIRNGLAFIRERPLLFLSRIWTREAQTFNPSSFLLRHLRRGAYEGLPDLARSGLCLLVLIAHFVVVGAAAVGAWGVRGSRSGREAAAAAGAREGERENEESAARSALQASVWGITLYHLAAAGALIGMSRFRVPLLPLWIPFSALLLVRPRETLRAATATPQRAVLVALTLLLVLALSAVCLNRAFPIEGA